MSQANVEVVRNGFDAFDAFMRGEQSEEALGGLADPEFEYDWPAERELPKPDHLRGVPEAFELIERIQSGWIDFVWEPVDFTEAPGNRVLVAVRQSGRGRVSGVPDKSHHFQVFTIRDGRVRKVDFFSRRAEALEAAGLRE
ncbi:MAG: nuclear transport factor 2 family protein [Solirubrobacterales bacterium]|jgi:ketosteroid isomerase-like protein